MPVILVLLVVEVSIITINQNNKTGLLKTVCSVLEQTVKDFEYIIIDGCSTDGSTKVIEDYNERINYWISEPDMGIYDAINKGICRANGRYLIFLNSGDCFTDCKVFENCIKAINENRDIDIFYGDIGIVNIGINKDRGYQKQPENVSLQFFKNETINHQASIIKASLFSEIGLYPVKYKLAGDYWFYLKCFMNNKSWRYLQLAMVDYDAGGVSNHQNLKYQQEKETIWQMLVPESIAMLLDRSQKLETVSRYKLVQFAISINEKVQAFKSRVIGEQVG